MHFISIHREILQSRATGRKAFSSDDKKNTLSIVYFMYINNKIQTGGINKKNISTRIYICVRFQRWDERFLRKSRAEIVAYRNDNWNNKFQSGSRLNSAYDRVYIRLDQWEDRWVRRRCRSLNRRRLWSVVLADGFVSEMSG